MNSGLWQEFMGAPDPSDERAVKLRILTLLSAQQHHREVISGWFSVRLDRIWP
jgi:hypothetical protein